MNMNDIKVLILAGGDSSRFWPLSDKQALYMLGKPIPYYCLSQLNRFGFNKVVIVTNRQNCSFYNKVITNFSQMNIELINQDDDRGMAGAVISAGKLIQGHKLLIVNPADIIEDVLFHDFRKELITDPDGIIAGVTLNTYFPGGYLEVDGNKIKGIVEKPTYLDYSHKIINIVFHYIKDTNRLLNEIDSIKTISDDIYERALDSLMKKGMSFKLLPYKGYWGYLKYPWHVLGISSFFLSKIKGKLINKAKVDKSAIIKGDVFLEDNVRIMENVKIQGPVYIGNGTIIGNNSIIRESMLGNNCIVGYSTEITRSYIGSDNWFHSNYIGDSVISNNICFGAGTVTANLRLDEACIKSWIKKKQIDTGKIKLGAMIGSNVRVGINCSLMPGVKIGNNSIVGAGVILDNDLPDNEFCKVSQQKLIINNIKNSNTLQFRQKQRSLIL